MQSLKLRRCFTAFLVLTFLVIPLTMVSAGSHSLKFDPSICTTKTLEDPDTGEIITYRACEGIVYVSNPIDTTYQSMNFYYPKAYDKGGRIGHYTTNKGPIFMPNDVGGYMPALPGSPGIDPRSGKLNAAAVALSKGYVVAYPGARGRTNKDSITNLFTGKAPACIVDLKAAVRYLRHNDRIMPGDAEKIVANGTSAGGALSSLLGATGNNKDYEPYLKEIGAAKERDDIFAASCYCPIQNLDNADTAYEWQFNGIGTFFPGYNEGVSDDLKTMFPAYLNSLRLRVPECHKKGALLTLNAYGEGNFKEYVKSFVIDSAQKALDNGADLSGLTWITIVDGIVTDIDFFEFSAAYSGRLPFKLPPAFDSLAYGSFETSLFGTATRDNQHFTLYSYQHHQNPNVPSYLADPTIIKMMNPTYYIGAKRTTVAQYWRIRHGTIDHHTSLAIPVILATMLQNKGYHVDFWMPWEQDHGGDYDLDELFEWIDMISNHCGH